MDSKDALITELRRLVAEQAEQLQRQAERIAELELELARAMKDSSTSSKPPSSDIVKPPTRRRTAGKRGKRKRGGQPGHTRRLREPLPPERVDEQIEYEINDKEVERLGLIPTDQFETIQHIELAESPIHVTEHRLRIFLAPDGERYLLNFDYFSANCSFAWNFDIKAQYCWAHLIRDIRFLLKHPNKKTKAWAEQLLDRSRRLFTAWHRREEMTEAGAHRSMITHRDRFLEIVRKPPGSKEATNLAARFQIVALQDGSTYDLSQDYFRFVIQPGVEPTNNHSEQQIRHGVIDRRITQGTRSDTGQRYHERMWTAIATCGKQNRSFFQFLQDSITAKLTRQSAPSLLFA